jgi:hypothetical protein
VQLDCPAREKVPLLHGLHVVAPELELYDPALHNEHALIPVEFAKLPAVQLEQKLTPLTLANLETGHNVHTDIPVREYAPGAQFKQMESPVSFPNKPAEQFKQVEKFDEFV